MLQITTRKKQSEGVNLHQVDILNFSLEKAYLYRIAKFGEDTLHSGSAKLLQVEDFQYGDFDLEL